MANQSPAVLGVKDFRLNLRREKAQIRNKVGMGLIIAGQHLQAKSQLLVPVDFGILKGSAFTRAEEKGMKTVVGIGYTAFYAMYVHENVEMKWKGLPRIAPSKGNYWDPAGRGQAKFLEAPARDRKVRQEMLNIIKNVMALPDKKRGKK